MKSSFDMGQYAEQVQRQAEECLANIRNERDLLRMMNDIVTTAENTLDANRQGEEHIACQAGCSTCCAVNVAVLFPEVVNIVDFVRTRFDPERQRTLIRWLAGMSEKVRGLSEEARISLRENCAFLDDSGSCSIYLVRPLICRAISSIDASHCEEAMQLAAIGVDRPIFMNMFQKNLMETTFVALAQGLTQLGFDDQSVQLTVGVQQLIEQPQQLDVFLLRQPVWPNHTSDF